MRQRIAAGVSLSERAVSSLAAAEIDRYQASFPLANLKPSPDNTRRQRIDNAGVTPEVIRELAIKDDESIDDLLSRLEAHAAKQEDDEAKRLWLGLASLAGSIHAVGHLIQPIIAMRDTGVIVAGERRWLACQLIGMTNASVNSRALTKRGQEKIARFMENENRENLLAHETVAGVRDVVSEMLDEGEEPTGRRMTEIFGAGKTQASMYAAFCALDEDDPVLATLLSGEVSSLRECYTLASARLKELRSEREANALATVGIEKPKPAPAPKAPKTPSFKVSLPTDTRTRRFLIKLGDTDLVPVEAREQLEELTHLWTDLNNTERSKQLTELLTTMIEAMEQPEQTEQ